MKKWKKMRKSEKNEKKWENEKNERMEKGFKKKKWEKWEKMKKWKKVKKWKKKKKEKKWKNETMKKNEKMKKWENQKMRKWKNEKMRKMRKMKKNGEKWWKKERKMKNFAFTRKILDDFQGFTVIVVTFFVKILNDFHDLVSECLFPEENQQLILGGSEFFHKKSDNFHWTWNKNTHFPTKIDEKNCKGQPFYQWVFF